MTPRSSNPFQAIEEAFDQMTRRFDEAARSWDRGEAPELWSATLGGAMATDVVDRDDAYEITVDVPGFTSDDITARVTDHTLHVEAEHDEATEERDEDFVRRERQRRSLQRSIRLPEAVDADDVTARTRNGVLTVTVPKTEPGEKGRKVVIEGA